MSKPKSSHTENPAAEKVVNQGRVNLQGKEGGKLRRDQSRIDQSEGPQGGPQPTSYQGHGAGFSTNRHP